MKYTTFQIEVSFDKLFESWPNQSGESSARKAFEVTIKSGEDIKQIEKALALYQSDNNGYYPCFDHSWYDTHESAVFEKYFKWQKNPLATGVYNQIHWERGISGDPSLPYSISFSSPGRDNAIALDKYMDDGNLSTGNIRSDSNGNRMEYYGIDQDVPTAISCPPGSLPT
jgi:hypothetical protein